MYSPVFSTVKVHLGNREVDSTVASVVVVADIVYTPICRANRSRNRKDPMRLLRIFAVLLGVAWMTWTALGAQSASARVETVAGVHAARFETSRGTLRTYFSSDSAPGDAIAGRIVSEPAGVTLQDRNANAAELNGWTVEWQGQTTPVSAGHYEWAVPVALRSGAGPLLLRDRDGRAVAQALIPVDPIPAVAHPVSPQDAGALPGDVESGSTVVIRGGFDGRLSGKTLTFGAADAELLAASPRQLAFRVPTTAVGLVGTRFAANDSVIEKMMRILELRASASTTQLLRDQRATLTVTVRGLNGVTEPVIVSVVNRSTAIVRIDDIDRPIVIKPSQVRRDGTFVVTRRIVGIQPGPFQIAASVGQLPTAQFDVRRSTARILTDWQARTGVGIAAGAGELVQRSVAQTEVDDFLSRQQAYQGDVQEVFAALLSHYCFDLRDDGLLRRRAAGAFGAGPGITLVSLGQDRPAAATITEREVNRLSFSDFLSRLTERFTDRQAVGYLFVRSRTPQAAITLDRQKGELTDRRFVMPAGDHDVVVNAAQTCRQRVTVNAFQTAVVDCGS
jgi:hypothetical protein